MDLTTLRNEIRHAEAKHGKNIALRRKYNKLLLTAGRKCPKGCKTDLEYERQKKQEAEAKRKLKEEAAARKKAEQAKKKEAAAAKRKAKADAAALRKANAAKKKAEREAKKAAAAAKKKAKADAAALKKAKAAEKKAAAEARKKEKAAKAAEKKAKAAEKKAKAAQKKATAKKKVSKLFPAVPNYTSMVLESRHSYILNDIIDMIDELGFGGFNAQRDIRYDKDYDYYHLGIRGHHFNKLQERLNGRPLNYKLEKKSLRFENRGKEAKRLFGSNYRDMHFYVLTPMSEKKASTPKKKATPKKRKANASASSSQKAKKTKVEGLFLEPFQKHGDLENHKQLYKQLHDGWRSALRRANPKTAEDVEVFNNRMVKLLITQFGWDWEKLYRIVILICGFSSKKYGSEFYVDEQFMDPIRLPKGDRGSPLFRLLKRYWKASPLDKHLGYVDFEFVLRTKYERIRRAKYLTEKTFVERFLVEIRNKKHAWSSREDPEITNVGQKFKNSGRIENNRHWSIEELAKCIVTYFIFDFQSPAARIVR